MRIGKFLCTLACVLTPASACFADAYDAPAGYYDSATGQGATLKTQLGTLMTFGPDGVVDPSPFGGDDHRIRTYGEMRVAGASIDRDPNNASNILLVYNRASVLGGWDEGATWNREHVWPQSRQPSQPVNDNDFIGNLGDQHSLRPANPGINSSRGNKPFGDINSSGSFGIQWVNGPYYPGDTDVGDIARSLFYSATRYTGLTLVNLDFNLAPELDFGLGPNEMGDLASLLKWNYADVPDDFERRRNQAIYSSDLSLVTFQRNRNAYIDHPEYVWSVFGGGNNDSQLSVGAGPAADGSSSTTVDLGRVIVGEAVPAAQSVLLSKTGTAPTYYDVAAGGDATSSVNGRFNAFIGGAGGGIIDAGLNASTATAGLKTGTITINNIDVSTGGTGQGSADANDLITVNLDVVDPSNASFASGLDQNLLAIDFGTLLVGGTINSGFDLFNLVQTAGFTADLDLDSIPGVGDTGVLSTDLSAFGGLAAGSSTGFLASFDTSSLGSFSATYTLNLSDEDIAGATSQVLTLQLLGEIVAILDGDLNGDGFVGIDDLNIVLIFWNQNVTPGDLLSGDPTGEGFVGIDDLNVVLVNWNNGTPPGVPGEAANIPEPGMLLLLGVSCAALLRRSVSFG